MLCYLCDECLRASARWLALSGIHCMQDQLEATLKTLRDDYRNAASDKDVLKSQLAQVQR